MSPSGFILTVDVEEICECRHVASLSASSILQKYNMVTLKQLLLNYTLTNGFLNFGMIIEA